MIKKFYILLIGVAIFQNAVAQLNEEDFRIYSYEMVKNVYEHFNNKNYGKAYQLIMSWQTKYATLPESTKVNLIVFAQDNAYDLAKYYALTGYNDHAIEQLNIAIERGYRNYYKLKADANFNTLYEEKEFVNLLDNLQRIGDNLYILRTSTKYSTYKTDLPNFTYENNSAASLQKLRQHYKLDSIAGNGNEETQIINLMRWVHHTIRHDGFKVSPAEQNALNFLRESEESNLPLNCHAMAITLNDVYQAMGIPSRYVTCFPKDSADWEYHVINAVYSKMNNKWLYMDPTNAAYVMDSSGQLLGIQEVRQHLINNEILILNPDANWNQTYTRNEPEYLWNYMAKNMFWFECPLDSEFDYETEKPGNTKTYIRLYPQGYTNNLYLKEETIYTHNEMDFWASPKKLLSDNSN